MLDAENALQQEALGIVGVNLLYGAFFMHHDPDRLVESLLDNLTTQRIEIDMIEFSGIEFRHVDNRVMSLKLVQLGLSGAAMFGPNGQVLQPAEVLYKKPVLVERGSFRPVCNPNIDMLECAQREFEKSLAQGEQVVELAEITMRNLIVGGQIDYRDFLARADVLAAAGKTVLISDYFEYYRLAAYLRKHTNRPIAITLGAASLLTLFEEKYYADLDGGILESFGRLFKNDLRLYVYPFLDPKTQQISTVDNLQIAPELSKLYGYLVDRGCILQLQNYDPNCLKIFSRDVLELIKAGDARWEEMVPSAIAEIIKRRGFFGCKKGAEPPAAEPERRYDN